MADNVENGGGGDGGGNGGAPSRAAPLPGQQGEILSLSQLIGAPIHALVEAESHAAMATARFIRDVGFTGGSGRLDDLGDLQMARFSRTLLNRDGEEERVEVEIPLITMLPIPALQVKDAQLDYTVKIVQAESMPRERRQLDTFDHDVARDLDPPATLRATFAREPSGRSRRSVDMLVRMKVRVEQADMPAGLSQLLNVAGGMARQEATPIAPPETDEE
ncbi:MAG: DUF2589 domain-containing protein [Azospirillaceae bacterium]